MKRTLNIKATEPQAEFLRQQTKYPAFVAGFGSGKTYIMCLKAFLGALHSPYAVVGIYEPSYKLVRKVLVPTMMKLFYDLGIDYHYHKTEFTWSPKIPGCGKIVFCTMEDPEAIVGDEMYQIHVDELDTLKFDKAQLCWNKIIARARQWPRDLDEQQMEWSETNKRMEPNNQVCVYTTPEGYSFVYDNWVTNANDDCSLIQASTYSNPYLPSSYVEAIKNQYPGELVNAYLHGQFVNLVGGNVYSEYSRDTNASNHTVDGTETLYIGCDFNVTKQAATVYVKRNGGHEWHAVAELVDMYDTPAMIDIIKSKWPDNKIIVYPDASGKSRKTVDASISDIALLQQAKFEVRANNSNPRVRDRVMAMNAALSKGRVFVNATTCPTVVSCLEKQAYDKNGEPDKKSGIDHQNDATTYPIAYEMPIRKPVVHIPIKFYTHSR